MDQDYLKEIQTKMLILKSINNVLNNIESLIEILADKDCTIHMDLKVQYELDRPKEIEKDESEMSIIESMTAKMLGEVPKEIRTTDKLNFNLPFANESVTIMVLNYLHQEYSSYKQKIIKQLNDLGVNP